MKKIFLVLVTGSLMLFSALAAAEATSTVQPPVPEPTYPTRKFSDVPHHVLFVCTGNYYRSRFAEAYFNYLSDQENLPILAFSRGTDGNPLIHDDSVSPYVLGKLEALNVPRQYARGMPEKIKSEDLNTADVIYTAQPVHRSIIVGKFPGHPKLSKIGAWNYPDSTDPRVLEGIRREVENLIRRYKEQR